ncbi:MAG: hypothetical protein HRU38_11935 [Saccharospirillaceae bacterium]|nr:hypothetical protein [Pseudomonadales bacterium]NRB79358.1 hypothetical protein [Saccharospirillaceae bacterium]
MAWQDDPISKPYIADSLMEILAQGLLGSMSRYTHFQIIEWCVRFRENQEELNAFYIQLSDDVIVQWELFIASSYTLEQMRSFSLSDIVLPKPYFEQWLNELIEFQDNQPVH